MVERTFNLVGTDLQMRDLFVLLLTWFYRNNSFYPNTIPKLVT